MKPNQLWLDLSRPELRVWVDERLQLAQAHGNSTQRVGFFRELPLFSLPPASAHPMRWTSFPWEDMVGKYALEKDFWMALDAARFTWLEAKPEKFTAPLALDLPLASDVVFYGGTFTPWHSGHSACLKLAPSGMPLIICPDKNPHKPLKTHDDVVGFFLELKRSMQSSLREGQWVYPGFLLKPQQNPTVSWVLRLQQNRPDLRVHLLVGYDSFLQLSTWTDASSLVKLLSGLLVVSRLEDDRSHEADATWALQQNPQLRVRFVGHHEHEHVSSTQLRQK